MSSSSALLFWRKAPKFATFVAARTFAANSIAVKSRPILGRGRPVALQRLAAYSQSTTSTNYETEEWAEKMIGHRISGNNGFGNTNFSDLVHWWYSNVYESTLNVHGIRLLLKLALDAEKRSEESGRKAGAIAELWDYVKDTMRASDFLAFLVVELVERGELDEAKIFTKLLSIRGTSFLQPLRLILWRELERRDNFGTENQQLDNIQQVVEQLSAIVQECYFEAQQTKKTPGRRSGGRPKKVRRSPTDDTAVEEAKKAEVLVEELEQYTDKITDRELIINSRYRKLLWLWMPNRVSRCLAETHGGWVDFSKKVRKARNSSRKMHRVDAKEVDKLGRSLVKLWAEIATRNDDANAWDRLMDYVEHNKLTMDEQLSRQWHKDRGEDGPNGTH